MSEWDEAPERGGWKQWTEEEARQTLAEWEESGSSLAAFAKKRGISSQRLSWWCKRLNKPGAGGPKKRQQGMGAHLVPAAVMSPLVDLGSGVEVSIRFSANGPVVEVANTTRVSPKWVGDLVVVVAAGRSLK